MVVSVPLPAPPAPGSLLALVDKRTDEAKRAIRERVARELWPVRRPWYVRAAQRVRDAGLVLLGRRAVVTIDEANFVDNHRGHHVCDPFDDE